MARVIRETEKERKLGTLVERELAQGEGNSDAAEHNRAEAMKYYLALPRGDEKPDRSAVISTDVADMCNAVLAMLVPILSVDAVAEFEPDGEQDEAGAKAESDVVNRLIIEDNRGFIRIQEAVKDALLMRNGVMKIRVAEREQRRVVQIEGASEEQRSALLADVPEGETRAIEGDQLIGTRRTRDFEIRAVPVENMTWTSGYGGDLQQIPFIAESMDYARSALVDMGVSRVLVDRLQTYGQNRNAVATARDHGQQRGQSATRDQELISCHEAYVLCDLDGDGISERYLVRVANGRQVLQYEAADLVPYAIGAPFINPHRVLGESLFDHLKATQDSKTALSRQFLDNVTIINNGRYVYDPARTNENDIMNPVAGGGIRSRDPGSVQALVVPDVTAGILMALTYEDKRRTERGGAALDMMGADKQLVGETAWGTERQYASREAMASLMAVNLAETLLRSLWLLTHEFLRRYSQSPVNVKRAGQWQEVDPAQWPTRTRVNVKAGLTPGQRGSLQGIYSQAMQVGAVAMQQGLNGVLASPQTLYRTAVEWMRIAGVPNPERLWIDPESPAAQAAAQQNAQSAQQATQQQLQLVQMQLQIEKLKIDEKAKADAAQIQLGYFEAEQKANIEEAKIAGQGVIDLEKARIDADARIHSGRDRNLAASPAAPGDAAG